jgi:hypothetical protein
MSEYTYDIAEALLPWDERPERPCVTVSHPEYGKIEVITNRDLEGRFRKVEKPSGMDYVQTAGTMQFSLPSDAATMKRKLAYMLRCAHDPLYTLDHPKEARRWHDEC